MLGDEHTARQSLDPLYESEVRFRRLAALSADIYWEQDEALRFTSFSTSRPSHIERSYTDKLVGKMRWQVPYLNMTGVDWAAHRAVLEARQPFRDLSWPLRQYDCRSVRVSGEAVFDAASTSKATRASLDITGRRRAEGCATRGA
jgi:PAS domain-containing protein